MGSAIVASHRAVEPDSQLPCLSSAVFGSPDKTMLSQNLYCGFPSVTCMHSGLAHAKNKHGAEDSAATTCSDASCPCAWHAG